MKTAKEMGIAIGQECILDVDKGKLKVRVEVLDARTVYNRVECLVKPLSGLGQEWVSSNRLSEFSAPKESNSPELPSHLR